MSHGQPSSRQRQPRVGVQPGIGPAGVMQLESSHRHDFITVKSQTRSSVAQTLASAGAVVGHPSASFTLDRPGSWSFRPGSSSTTFVSWRSGGGVDDAPLQPAAAHATTSPAADAIRRTRSRASRDRQRGGGDGFVVAMGKPR